MTKQMTAEQFLNDVATHKIKILLDQGVYRHLLFRAPKDSWNMWFEIVTWPDNLAINGDMGTWTFSRLPDMFSFFRQSSELSGRINAQYWCGKITSESRYGGPSEKFDADTFKANVLSSLDDYELDASQKSSIIDALEDDVLGEDESSVRRALADFKYGDFEFSDSWEISGKAYTYHYLWCLHAIVWAIQQYGAMRINDAILEAK